jgi:hypothetical protein
VRPAVAALLFSVLAAACRDATPTRCERVCQREAQCLSKLNRDDPHDVAECVEQCGKLERDPANVKQVDDHVACVDKAGSSCEAVVECQ